MIKVLLIEDDPKISKYLEMELRYNNYAVDTAKTGKEGLKKFKENSYSLILLDLMLPMESGESVCRQIREESEVPIIILTAKNHISNKVELLDMGADDYITKPFVIEELFARMRVVLRNKKNILNPDLLIYQNIKINLAEKKAYVDEELISLTKTEFNLLHYLTLNNEIVLSREQILSNVWGYDYFGGEKIVDVFINTLRKKIEGENKLIKTVRGFGYTLKK